MFRMKIHHYGIAVKDLDEAFKYVKENFDIESFTYPLFDEKQNVTLQIITLKNGTRFELVCGDTVKNLFGIYHICIKGKIKGTTIKDEKEAVLFDNKKVKFKMTPIGIIEELEE